MVTMEKVLNMSPICNAVCTVVKVTNAEFSEWLPWQLQSARGAMVTVPCAMLAVATFRFAKLLPRQVRVR